MADLIDREELLKKRCYSFQTEFGAFPKHEHFIKRDDIVSMPPADTERHAHWIFKCGGIDRTGNYFVYACSRCDKTIRVYQGYEMVEDYPYCRCGCKMDEVENEKD